MKMGGCLWTTEPFPELIQHCSRLAFGICFPALGLSHSRREILTSTLAHSLAMNE